MKEVSVLNFDAPRLLCMIFYPFWRDCFLVLLRPCFLYDPLSILFSGQEPNSISSCIHRENKNCMVEKSLTVYLSQDCFRDQSEQRTEVLSKKLKQRQEMIFFE